MGLQGFQVFPEQGQSGGVHWRKVIFKQKIALVLWNSHGLQIRGILAEIEIYTLIFEVPWRQGV